MENTQSEKDLINCLNSTTKFVQKIIDSGKLDNDGMMKSFLITQVESNEMTIRKYDKNTLKKEK